MIVAVWLKSTLDMMVAIVVVGRQPGGLNSGPVVLEDGQEH